MKTVTQYIVAWSLVLCGWCISEVNAVDCPNVSSCDCRVEHRKLNGDQNSYTVADCEGDIEVTSLNFSLYSGNNDIRKLIFTNTTIRTFKNVFNGLKIDTITIQAQKLKLQEDSFSHLKNTLTHVSLINVNISRQWKLDYLKPLDNLESLVLDHNGIYPEHFPNYVFRTISLTSLRHLSLRYCKIAIMSEKALEGLTNLETLDLSHNFLPMVPNAILLLKKLRKVNLSFNKRLIYVHDYAFKTMRQLEEIDISNTDLSTISEFAFYGLENSLKSLQLHHALLQDGHFASMKELKKLKFIDISYNKIVEIHNTSFEGFVALEELDISGQFDTRDGVAYRLGFIDSVFKGVERKLKVLRIRNLGMDVSLPLAALKSLRRLQILDASENEFTEIYESFFYGIKARTIYLKDMQITDVSYAAFETLPAGVNIYFDRNNISNISFVLDTPICLFKKLSLVGNPVTCDCDVIEIASTNRVPEFKGTCADHLYRGENLRNVHEVEITKKNCDTTGYKTINHCSYSNSASRVTRNVVFLAVVLKLLATIYAF